MIDWELASLASLIEAKNFATEITLIVSGCVITGKAAPVNFYYQQMQADFPPESPGDAAVLWRDLRSLRTTQAEEQDTAPYLYLIDVLIHTGQYAFATSTLKVKLDQVAAWGRNNFTFITLDELRPPPDQPSAPDNIHPRAP